MKNEKLKIKNLGNVTILIILAAMLFLFKLGSFSLYDAAETTYGEFTKGILRTGDWLTLHYNGQIIFDKPPLYYWLAAGLSLIFGLNEWVLRIWATLAGVLTVVTTYYLGKELYNERTGFFSGLISLTAFQFLIQSRIAELDIVLTLFMMLGLLLWLKWYKTEKRTFIILAYCPLALGMLIKGLLAVALPGFAVLLFLFFRKELNKIKAMAPLWGILIIAVIGLPWYILEYLRHGQIFLDFALGFLFLSRFQGVVSGHTGPWFYYFLALTLGFAPWSHFIPLSLWRSIKQLTTNYKLQNNSAELLILCFVIPAFIVFSIAKTKIPNYILPLYPFLAMMVGKLWADFLDDNSTFKSMLISHLCLAVVVILVFIAAVIAGSQYTGLYQAMLPQLTLLGLVMAVGSIASILLFCSQRYLASFYVLPIMVFALTFILTIQTLPMIENYKGTKELGQKVAAVIKPNEQIAAYNVGNRPGIVFYNVKPVIYLKNEKELAAFLKNKRGYCFTTVNEANNLKNKILFSFNNSDLVVLR
jgi:4-amino-4-deoxy-L-arabinose transferase-like glycosyltransferase